MGLKKSRRASSEKLDDKQWAQDDERAG
jgi:hypothetical protein